MELPQPGLLGLNFQQPGLRFLPVTGIELPPLLQPRFRPGLTGIEIPQQGFTGIEVFCQQERTCTTAFKTTAYWDHQEGRKLDTKAFTKFNLTRTRI
ncbi:hypothetical protein ACFX15_001276 [Malus domestica]